MVLLRDLYGKKVIRKMKKKLVILGSAIRGGALLILDSIKRSANSPYEPVGILDDTDGILGSSIMSIKVIGGLDQLSQLKNDLFFDEAIIAIGSVTGRKKIFDLLRKLNIKLANVIDDSVLIRSAVSMGVGNVIMPNCNIGPLVTIGDNNFICSNTTIEHESVIGDGNSFSAGCTFAGRVKIGNLNTFGTRSGAKADTLIANEEIILQGTIL